MADIFCDWCGEFTVNYTCVYNGDLQYVCDYCYPAPFDDQDDDLPKLCPVCGEKIVLTGDTTDGRVIGSCGDAFSRESYKDKEKSCPQST